MNIDIIQERLESYQCETQLDEENAIKEITQEIALLALSRVDFFKVADFHGGTALRILYNLQRFSEDLDFALFEPKDKFDFKYYLEKMEQEFQGFGYNVEIQDRSKVDNNVKKAFLKDNSIGKLLTLSYPVHPKNMRKIKIKLEIDVNPPKGTINELKYLDFPLPFGVVTKDLSSLFSGKLHALLCRKYIKGRDWYDFLWCTSRKAPINFTFLTDAINQNGPWANQKFNVDENWLMDNLTKKIQTIDWGLAATDVERFIKPVEKDSLSLWSPDFFHDRVEKLSLYL